MSVLIIQRHRLLALLLAQWEAAHGRIGTQLHIRLQRLWRVLPEDHSWQALKNLLCPVFASNARQQQDFNELYDRLLYQLEAVDETNGDNDIESDASEDFSEKGNSSTGSAQKEKPQGPAPDTGLIHRRSPLVIELDNLDRYDQPPFTWNIVPETADELKNIDLGEGFDKTLLQLRRRELAGGRALDISATVQASIRQAGLPTLRYRDRTRPPEYLLLVEQLSYNDHRSGLFDFFYQKLRSNAVFAERFFYNGDPRICRNERFPAGLGIPDLRQRYPNARLIIFGTGYRLISSQTGQLAEWTSSLAGWPARVLLTPTMRPDWGYREKLLQKIFILLPASVRSLQYVAESPEIATVRYEALPDYIRRMAEQRPIELKDPIIVSLRRHFEPEMLCWIAACAIYPALHYGLTLRIGQLLSDSFGTKLLTAEKLLALSRIPWFIEGHIPPKYKDELRGYFAHRFPQQHEAVWNNLQQLLENNPPPENSTAWLEHQINLAFLRIGASAKPNEADLDLLHAVVRRSSMGESFLVPTRWEEVLRRLGLAEVDSGIHDKAADFLFQLLCTPSNLRGIPAEQLAASQEWAKKWLYQNDPIMPLVLESAESMDLKLRVVEIKTDRLLLNRRFFGELKEQLAEIPEQEKRNITTSIASITHSGTGDAVYGNKHIITLGQRILDISDTRPVEDAIGQLIDFTEASSSLLLSKAHELCGLFNSLLRKDEGRRVSDEIIKANFEEVVERLIILLKEVRILSKNAAVIKQFDELITQFDNDYVPPVKEPNPLPLPYQGKKALIIGVDKAFRLQIGNTLGGIGFTISKDDIVAKKNIVGVDMVFIATMDMTLQKLLIENIRRRDEIIPILIFCNKYPTVRNKAFENNNVYVLLGAVQPENMAKALSDIFVKKGKSEKLSLYENIFAFVSDKPRSLRSRPLICSRCNEIRADLSKCERPYCEFEEYRDRMLDTFGKEIPAKYYISLIGGVNASKTTYLLALIDTLLHDSKVKKALKKMGIDDVLIIDPNSWKYFNTKIQQAKYARLAATFPHEPLQFINIILYPTGKKPIEITFFNSAGEKIEDEFLSDNYRTESHELKGGGALFFVDPYEDSKLNNLLNYPKDISTYGPCKDFDIVDFIHKVMQFVNRGVRAVNNPLGICVTKFDLLMHQIPYLLPDSPFLEPTNPKFFKDINKHSGELSAFLEENSTTIHPNELKNKFNSIKYFPVAPFGNDSNPAIWEKRNPQGVLAPFLWLLKELKILPGY